MKTKICYLYVIPKHAIQHVYEEQNGSFVETAIMRECNERIFTDEEYAGEYVGKRNIKYQVFDVVRNNQIIRICTSNDIKIISLKV